MKPFHVNRHGRIVFPCNFFPELDFSLFDTLDDFEAVVRRDFSEKARSAHDIVARLDAGAYRTRYELLRDFAVHLFWLHRHTLTMYEQRPTRWRDVPRGRPDVYLPVLERPEAGDGIAVVEAGAGALPAAWDAGAEETMLGLLLDVARADRAAGPGIPALNPTVGEAIGQPGRLAYRLIRHDPDWPRYSEDDVLGYSHREPALEALMRHAMVLRNEVPWDPDAACLAPIGALSPDDVVVVLHPRRADVQRFIHRVRAERPARARALRAIEPRPVAPVPPIDVRARFTVMPRLEALAVEVGEHVCTNDDLVRNTAYCWSPMTAADVLQKTGIAERRYTARGLDELALAAAHAALDRAGRAPEELGGVLCCSCTSGQGCPSVAAWVAGQLGMLQTHVAFDLVAACAGFCFGLREAVGLLQDSGRPILLICAEKFSDKIGTVRASRMIFGDGAAALVVGPAPEGAAPDVEVLQTYASGPMPEVTSILWPNPAFDNGFTVLGAEVRALVARYLAQMTRELAALPHPGGGPGSCLDAVDLIVPHQANETMVRRLAREAGLDPARLYFDIARVGNTSAASIPVALHDAIRDGTIRGPQRVFAPGFGAGAVGGYAVMRIDPAIAAW